MKPRISVLTPTIRPEGLKVTQECLKQQTFTEFEWLVEVNHTGKHDLNAAYNRMLKRAQGVLIVSLQDYIRVRPDFLERWWQAYEANRTSFMTAPVGKVNTFDAGDMPRWDWRAYRMNDTDTIRENEFRCWEIDNGAAPLEALKKIGGFDERLDEWWSSDNVSVGKRAHLAGYTFKCIFDNPGIAFDHDLHMSHPFRGNERPERVKLILEEYETEPLPPLC